MEFPMEYQVNGTYCLDEKPKFTRWWLDNCNDENFNKMEFEKITEIHDRLGLQFDFKK